MKDALITRGDLRQVGGEDEGGDCEWRLIAANPPTQISGMQSAAARSALTTALRWPLRGDPVDAQSRHRHSAIVIPIKIERLKLWSRWMLESAGWLISLGLLAASAPVAAIAVLAWLITGSNTMLVLGIISGLSLGLAGVWQLLRRLDRAACPLKHAPAEMA